MRIGMVAPLAEPVPPPLYGGTERVVSVLTEELVRRGHDVTLFATADSRTRAKLVPCAQTGLRAADKLDDSGMYAVMELGEAYRRADKFDVIHNHVDFFAFPFARLTPTPTVTTTHGRLDMRRTQQIIERFPEQPLVSISDAQRDPVPNQCWVATVYNGIDLSNYHFRPNHGKYLVFLGRIAPEKRPDRAIEIARDTGMPLIIAAKVDPVDQDYYEQAIRPLIDSSKLIEFIGEVNEHEKDKLLGEAYAYLFAIDWPEPFGLTMVEAMATGTPVIATAAGSVPEVVVDGVTGFVRRSLHDMVDAVPHVGELDRAACRAHVERHFSAEAMASGYERVYQRLIERGDRPVRYPDLAAGASDAFDIPA